MSSPVSAHLADTLRCKAHDSWSWLPAKHYQAEDLHLQSSTDLSRRTGWLLNLLRQL